MSKNSDEKKWYSVELNASTRRGLKECEDFKEFLNETVDKFEPSGCFECIHFEILASQDEADAINKWLDKNVYYDAIKERRV